jgi:hypothetical protein
MFYRNISRSVRQGSFTRRARYSGLEVGDEIKAAHNEFEKFLLSRERKQR